MKGLLSLLATFTLIGIFLAASADTAYAHERRALGKYTLIVGWQDEPTLVEVRNAVFLRVFETATNRAIEGLDKSVKATVRAGGAPAFAVALQPLAGQPGQYVAPIVPSRAGDYTFHFRGKVEDIELNEQFDSGPGRFQVVSSAGDITYPDAAASRAELTREMRQLQSDRMLDRTLVVVALAAGLGGLALSLLRGRGRRATAVLMLAMVATAAPAAAAPSRDTVVTSSDPAPNARLSTSPARVTMSFSDEIEVTRSGVGLIRSDGSTISLPKPRAGATARAMIVDLAAPLTPGVYAVRWSVLNHDGHEQQGYFAFAVGADPPADLRGFALTATAEGVTARLDITPGRLGENSYRLTTAASGAAFQPERASLVFTPAALGVASVAAVLSASSGAFVGTGMELALSGAYTITAAVRRAGAAQDIPITFELTAPAQQATPSPSPTPIPTPAPTASPIATPTAAATPTPADGALSGPLVAIAVLALLVLPALAVALMRRRP